LYVAALSDCPRLARRAPHRIFTLYLGNPISSIETHSSPDSLGATLRAFTFYLGNPISSILTILFILSTKGYPC